MGAAIARDQVAGEGSHDGPGATARRSPLDDRRAWIALAAVNGIGDVRFGGLVGSYGGAKAVLEASLRGTPAQVRWRFEERAGARLPSEVVDRIREAAADPGAVERRCRELGVATVTPMDTAYPARLLELDPPPPVLYVQGAWAGLEVERSVAVVGTRRPTVAGRALAAQVATRLVEWGAVVVSGLAIGVDGAAHAAAMEAGGLTMAVIGGGHATPGPRANRFLLQRILDTGGALIGELPPDAPPSPGTFPRRNRIISILADATIVIEAPSRSGALITAHHALEQGRPVLAAPGRPGDPATAGCLALLRETPARPLVGLDELVSDLGYDAPRPGADGAGGVRAGEGAPDAGNRLDPGDPLDAAGAVEPSANAGTQPRPDRRLGAEAAVRMLAPAERAVAERLRRGPATADALIAATGLPPAVASGALTLLMLRGWAQAVGPAYLAAGPLLREGRRSEGGR